MTLPRNANTIAILLAVCLSACGSGGGYSTPPVAQVTVSVSGLSTPLNTGASRTFTAFAQVTVSVSVTP